MQIYYETTRPIRPGEELLLGPKRPISVGGQEEEGEVAASDKRDEHRRHDSSSSSLRHQSDSDRREGSGVGVGGGGGGGSSEDDDEPGVKCLKCEKTMLDIYSYVSPTLIFYIIVSLLFLTADTGQFLCPSLFDVVWLCFDAYIIFVRVVTY